MDEIQTLLSAATYRIRDLRLSHKYTQKYVAEAINVSRITYVRYESEIRQMKTGELIALSRLYNVSTDYILGLTNFDAPHFWQYMDFDR